MNGTLWMVIGASALVVAVFAWMLRRAWLRNRLRGGARRRVLASLQRARGQNDRHRRLLETDAVLALALGDLGFAGTAGEKLQKADNLLADREGVWRAHKLRNRIAHETGIALNDRELENALSVLEAAILRLCR